MAEDFKVEMSPASFRRVMLMAKESGPALKRQLAKRIREAAAPAAQAARDKVMGELPPKANQAGKLRRMLGGSKFGANHNHTGLRAAIAKGVSVATSSGAKTAGVRIKSSAKFLQPDQKNMNRTYNQATFRHPVFGKGSVPQHGLRWFYEPIASKKNEISAAVLRAMQDAADELGKL